MKLVAAVVLAAGCAHASSSLPPAVALQPPLDSLAFYVGNWDCKGVYFKTADQAAEAWTARMIVAPELDGSWLSVQMIGPGTNHTAEHKGYDPSTKTWHHLAVAPGGSWGTMTSKGWEGTHMVFTADQPDDHTHATFTKRGDRSYSHLVSRDTDHGEEKLWEKTCTKHG